ncbi:MAG: RsmG family class I SAM-dependent methyltransferase, partial [Candidatus Baltobacteraceae bacterium]
MTSIASLLESSGVESALAARLGHFGTLVLEANRRFNLTGAKTPDELAGHILDSLSVVPYVRAPYVDVGSGAGFPAIPVALATGTSVTMIEATAKKARFLETILAALELPGRVLADRAELAGHDPELRERFASGT